MKNGGGDGGWTCSFSSTRECTKITFIRRLIRETKTVGGSVGQEGQNQGRTTIVFYGS